MRWLGMRHPIAVETGSRATTSHASSTPMGFRSGLDGVSPHRLSRCAAAVLMPLRFISEQHSIPSPTGPLFNRTVCKPGGERLRRAHFNVPEGPSDGSRSVKVATRPKPPETRTIRNAPSRGARICRISPMPVRASYVSERPAGFAMKFNPCAFWRLFAATKNGQKNAVRNESDGVLNLDWRRRVTSP